MLRAVSKTRDSECDGSHYNWPRLIERYLPYALLVIALLVLHIHMDLTTGDAADFAEQLSKHSVLEFIEVRYFGWTSRLLAELVLIFIIHSPIVWAIVDIGAWVLLYWSIIRLANLFGADRGGPVVRSAADFVLSVCNDERSWLDSHYGELHLPDFVRVLCSRVRADNVLRR